MDSRAQRPPIHDIHFKHPSGAGALVEVVHLGELRQRRLDHSIYRCQRRDFHLFQLVTRGRGRHHFDFGSIRLKRGDLFHLRPGQVDWFDEGSTHEALLLVFVPEALPNRDALRLRLTNPLRLPGNDFARVEGLLRLIERFQSEPLLRAATLQLLQTFTATIDALHARAASSATRSPAKLALCEQFDQLLNEHAHTSRSVADYAERLGISTKTLARAADEILGRSPKQHIDARVTLQAKRLLVHTEDTVDDIAAQLGFTETTNFVKFFRRTESCTPHGFRHQFRTAGPTR